MQIGNQDGVKAAVNRFRDLDPGGTLLKKGSSGWPDISTLPDDLSQWKAYDKLQRTLQILVDDHDADPTPPEPPTNGNEYHALHEAQARMFLANHPLDCLTAPQWMVPVVTADLGYRDWYDQATIDQLFGRFGIVEVWCDCREQDGTPYGTAEAMLQELNNLSGPAWGQCETQAEFDHAYVHGCRRMVGNLSALNDSALNKVRSAEVIVSVELYRNVQPWMTPDWKGCNDGVGGNTIACYESETEGAVYTSVQEYKDLGLYVPRQDSVYGVGLHPEDWPNLA